MDTFRPRLEILPGEQCELWPQLRPLQSLGFVLYGGTAVALRLGHRRSVDFDFFNSNLIDQSHLRAACAFLQQTAVRQDRPNTLEVVTPTGVKIAFYGGIEFGRIGEPQGTVDGVLWVASLDDLMATKLKVILQRTEAKDYQDIAAMVRAGTRLETGLAAAEQMFHPMFAPSEALKAVVYFRGGDLDRLSADDRKTLIDAARGVRSLPAVSLSPSLTAAEKISPREAPIISAAQQSPQGPQMSM